MATKRKNPKAHFLDPMGRVRTQSLFWQFKNEKYTPLYTLEDFDHDDCLSLKKLYLEMSDLGEYDFANKYFYNYDHWMRICKHAMLFPYIEKIREELELKLRSEAIKKIYDLAKGTNPAALNAAKFISKREWELKHSSSRKNKKEKEKNSMLNEAVNQDLIRIKKK